MIEYQNLVGREYVPGRVDCFSIVRDFFAQNFDIVMPNYARPTNFWEADLNFYMDRYYKHGFRILDVHPSEYQMGDVMLISYMSSFPNHAAILVENGNILHHFTNRLSSVDPYRGVWRNNTTAVLRHKDVVIEQVQELVDITTVIPPSIRRKIDATIADNHQPPEEV